MNTVIDIRPATIEEVLASGMFDELDGELSVRYPGSPINGIDPTEFTAANGFLVLALNGLEPVGCGAFRPVDARTVEIKRMFVRPQFRGRGIARSILAELERAARVRGHERAILETGYRQPEAIALYRSCGYDEIERYEPYVESVGSICFGKRL